MKNKGRRQKAGYDSSLAGICNTKGMGAYLTRPIKSMSSKGHASGKYAKKLWHKRLRAYFKSKTKNIYDPTTIPLG